MNSFFRRLHIGSNPSPVRDWLIVLTFALMAFAGIVVWNIWAFDTVARGGSIGSPSITAPPAFSRSLIDAIHVIFANRAVEEAKYQTGGYQYADPSQ